SSAKAVEPIRTGMRIPVASRLAWCLHFNTKTPTYDSILEDFRPHFSKDADRGDFALSIL
ncbi:MAG TPA: hypothetical protein V6C82_01770, partial [Chroococcales cyanobacterium]